MMLPSPTELGSISLPYKGILVGSFYSSVALFRSHKLEGNALGIQWFGLRAFTAKAWILSLVREPRSWQTAWSGQNKTHKLREKKIPGSVGSVREGPQGQQDTPVLTCRRITGNKLCWAQPQGSRTWGPSGQRTLPTEPAEVVSLPGHHHPSFHRPLGHQSTNPRACWNIYLIRISWHQFYLLGKESLW